MNLSPSDLARLPVARNAPRRREGLKGREGRKGKGEEKRGGVVARVLCCPSEFDFSRRVARVAPYPPALSTMHCALPTHPHQANAPSTKHQALSTIFPVDTGTEV